jgi:hypothetical protein
LDLLDNDKTEEALEDFRGHGFETVDLAITGMVRDERTYEALVFYGKLPDGTEKIWLMDSREVIEMADILVEKLESSEAVKDEHWYEPVKDVPDKGGRFDIPAGTVLKRREVKSGETDYVRVRESFPAELDEKNPTNYDNWRVAQFAGRSFIMRAKSPVKPRQTPQ